MEGNCIRKEKVADSKIAGYAWGAVRKPHVISGGKGRGGAHPP